MAALVIVVLVGLAPLVPALSTAAADATASGEASFLPIADDGDTQATSVSTVEGSVQEGPPVVWKERVMWGCEPWATGDCVLDQRADEAWDLEESSKTMVDVGEYDPEPTFVLEAVMDASSVDAVHVRLVDESTDSAVEESTVSTSNDAPTRVRSSAFDLDGSHEYAFEVRVDDELNDLELGGVHMVKLLSAQTGAQDTVTTVKLSGGDQVSEESDISRRTALWQYDRSAFDGDVEVYFEAVADLGGSCIVPCTADIELVRVRDGVTVADVTYKFSPEIERKRTGEISGSLDPGEEYMVRIGDVETGNTMTLYLARIVVEQDGLDETLQYVDLSWTASTRSTSFQDIGYPAVHNGSTEGDPARGYFEATMRVDLDGETAEPVAGVLGAQASARLTNGSADGAVVEDSVITTTNTTPTRVRTDTALDLSSSDAEYRAQLRSMNGLIASEVRNAWLISHQDDV